MNALIPWITSGMGSAATYPSTWLLLTAPAAIPGINAFMLGARQSNPQTTLRIIWTNTWYDPGREAEAANTLMDAGADVLTHHTDSSAVPRAANARKAWVVGYHSDMRHAAPDSHLISVTHHWGRYYIGRVRQVMAGKWQADSVWGGMDNDFVRVQALSDAVPASLKARMTEAEQALKAGSLHPFAGPIRDNDGMQRVAGGAKLSDADIGQMNWFVEGVSGKVPR